MEINKESLLLTDQKEVMDASLVQQLLSSTYWAKNRSISEIKRSMEASECFAVFDGKQMVAFARMVTDGVSVHWLCDVVVDPKRQRKGIGQALLDFVLKEHQWKGLGILITKDAHLLYEKYGYRLNSEEFMMKEDQHLG